MPVDQPPEQPRLRIWQQNVNKLFDAQSDLLVSLGRTFDICALQEPYMDFKGMTQVGSTWIPLYPKNHKKNPKETRSIMLINRQLSPDAWTPISIDSLDVTAVQLQGDFGTIHIINIYNNCKHNDSFTVVKNYLREPQAWVCTQLPLSFVWLGDFNWHHFLWDEEQNNHLFTNSALTLTQPLLNMLGQYNMKMVLPKDTPTLKASSTGNYTRVDNVFCSENVLQAIISCDTNPSRRPLKADHYPIITIFDISGSNSACHPSQIHGQVCDLTHPVYP